MCTARIAELAIRYRLPTIFGNRGYVEAGGLMSYGQKLDELRRAASYVDKISEAQTRAICPLSSRTLELVINQTTAKALASRSRTAFARGRGDSMMDRREFTAAVGFDLSPCRS
jgi:hypothetical protein